MSSVSEYNMYFSIPVDVLESQIIEICDLLSKQDSPFPFWKN